MELAWSLAAAANDHLKGAQRFDVYVALGAGDTAIAIRDLTRLVAREHVELDAEVAAAVKAWWAANHRGDAAPVAELATSCDPPPPPVAAPPKTAALSTTRKYLRPNRTR